MGEWSIQCSALITKASHTRRCERRYEVTKHILSLRMNELVARVYTTTNDDSVVICGGFFIVTQGKYTYTDF